MLESYGCIRDRGANGSDMDRIVVKPYLYPFLFSDTDTDRIVDGYGYGSDIKRIRIGYPFLNTIFY